MKNNYISFKFKAISENESLARNVVSCFALQLNPSLIDISDIKTAVSEAVTNCIVHGYPSGNGEICINAFINNDNLHINVFDDGVGISNVRQALEPFYTSKPEQERSGMGFTIMQNFMDEVHVDSVFGRGTKVYMTKKIKADA